MVIINNCGNNNIIGAIILITIIIVSKHSAYEGKDNWLWMILVTEVSGAEQILSTLTPQQMGLVALLQSEHTHTRTQTRAHTLACARDQKVHDCLRQHHQNVAYISKLSLSTHSAHVACRHNHWKPCLTFPYPMVYTFGTLKN